jgi:hypothetical protein
MCLSRHHSRYAGLQVLVTPVMMVDLNGLTVWWGAGGTTSADCSEEMSAGKTATEKSGGYIDIKANNSLVISSSATILKQSKSSTMELIERPTDIPADGLVLFVVKGRYNVE